METWKGVGIASKPDAAAVAAASGTATGSSTAGRRRSWSSAPLSRRWTAARRCPAPAH